MNWKTGVCSVSFRANSVEEIIAAAAAAGLDGIEWGADVHVPVGDIEKAKQVRALTEAAGLQVLSYGSYYDLSSQEVWCFDGLLNTAEALGVKTIRVWGGKQGSAELTESAWNALAWQGHICAQRAAARGMTLSLECHNGTVTDDWKKELDFLAKADDPALRAYWQPNQLKGEKYDLFSARALAKQVTNVHVFYWQPDEKKALGAHTKLSLTYGYEQWEKLLTVFEEGLNPEEEHAFLLEFMPDDKIESLWEEAHTLNEMLTLRGLRKADADACQAPILLPPPKKLALTGDCLPFSADGELLMDDAAGYETLRAACGDCGDISKRLAKLKLTLSTPNIPAVVMKKNAALAAEGYRLTVAAAPRSKSAQVTLEYADIHGGFYGLATLAQLLGDQPQSPAGTLPLGTVEDAPDLAVRGYMLDIARNRVPTRESLFALVDRIAFWKINHLELYFEAVPFEYASYPEMWQGRELLTGEDILALDAYCRTRCIELVPTQNNFGHMDRWLKERFRDMAECPDGFTFMDTFLPDPRCLDPNDPRSLELDEKLAADLLPYFTSNKYNICCDETLELGMGKSKAECEARSMEAVYVDFVNKVCDIAHRWGKTPLIWDDIVRSAPEQLVRLPKDAILLHWGYAECEPMEANVQRLHDLNRPFYVCPGTGSWNAYIGMTDKMISNILRSARMAVKYGAEGLLTTDWGDAGHMQSISSGYAGIALGAAAGWNADASEKMDLAQALDDCVFLDTAHKMGQFVLDAGRYERYEPVTMGNSSTTMRFFWQHEYDIMKDGDPAAPDRLEHYLDSLLPELEAARMQCEDAGKIVGEYRYGIDFVKAVQDVPRAFAARQAGDAAAEKAAWQRILTNLPACALRLERIWLARCRQSWLDETVAEFNGVLNLARERMTQLNG